MLPTARQLREGKECHGIDVEWYTSIGSSFFTEVRPRSSGEVQEEMKAGYGEEDLSETELSPATC